MITHPEKLLFPGDGITKADVAGYYHDVARVLLPHLRRRPITMERFPAGIDEAGFIQKDVVKGFPAWLTRIEAPRKEGGMVHYASAGSVRALAWLANQNTIALHVWLSRAPRLDRPDLCVIDLDPSQQDADALRTTVLAVRDAFTELGHESWVKTSGSKGFHVAARLGPRATFDTSSDLALRVARTVESKLPALVTLEFRKADRGGRILIDVARNRALQPAGEARRAGVGTVHVGRSRDRGRRAADIHAASHGRAHCARRRSLVAAGPAVRDEEPSAQLNYET